MIRVNGLTKTYGAGTRAAEEVLHGVSFDLPETGFVCILGRSGSGKTSLLNAVGGLDSFDGGTVEIDGAVMTRSDTGTMERKRNEYFGYVFQNYYLLPEHSAAYNVYLGLHSLDLTEEEKLRRVGDALKKVGMLRFRKRLVGELSGGQQQRIAIARAIAKSPKVIFADEPTGNLDEESTLTVCALLKKLSKTGLVVMVTHEERLADFFADRVITIDDGRITGDVTDWVRGDLLSADANTVYAGDCREAVFADGTVRLRVLSEEGSAPADITVVIENGRILIKTDDRRLTMVSKTADAPVVREGSRPKLDRRQLEEAEEGLPDGPVQPSARSKKRTGLGLPMLFAEMKTTASRKKLRSAATGVFLVLLSLMLLLSVSDLTAAARVKKEDFITADSHILRMDIAKGKNWNDRTAWSVAEYVPALLAALEETGLDYDLIPHTNLPFGFTTDILPQYGTLSMSLGKYNLANVKRLDPSTLLCGRMPERCDEIVVDRWVIRNCSEKDGIVQNFIVNEEYMLGKRIYMENKAYYPVIVGICDSGEPDIYMTSAGLLSVGIKGLSVMPYSEFVAATGRTDVAPPEPGECFLLDELAGGFYKGKIGTQMNLPNGMKLYVRESVKGAFYEEARITTAIVVADAYVEELLRFAVGGVTHFDIWCADKEAVRSAVTGSLPEELSGMLLIDADDTYGREYRAFMAGRTVRLQTRFLITAAVGLLCLVMLYVIQRFRVRDRMGMIAVYRMLGIPGRDSVGVFILENLLLTVRFAVPAVFLAWAVVSLLPVLGVGGLSVTVPLWAPFAVLGILLAAGVVIAAAAVMRLTAMPPAGLAAKYDF